MAAPGRPAILSIVTALALALGGASAAPAPGALGFEHRLHDRNLVVRGDEPLPCGRCHALRGGARIDRPGHAACFGACHGPAPRRGEPAGERLAVCTACHAAAAVTSAASRGYPVHYPPYTLEPDFAVTIGHKRHAALACATCHAGGKPAPHQRCAACPASSAWPPRSRTPATRRAAAQARAARRATAA